MLFELRGLVMGIVSGGAVDFRPVMAAVSTAATALALARRPARHAPASRGSASAGSGAIAAARRSLSSAKP